MNHPQLTTRAHRTLLAALTALATTLTAAPALAADGTYAQILCANPATGQGLGVDRVDGLTTPASAGAWQASIGLSTCGTEPKTAANAITFGPHTAANVPYGGYAALHYSVADPALTLEHARYYRAFASGDHPFETSTRMIQHGGANASNPSAPTNGWDSFWTGNGHAAGRLDQPFAHENEVQAEHSGRSFSITAQCRDAGGDCAHGVGEWAYRFFGGEAQLRDAEAPVIEALSGSLLSGGAVSTEQLTFHVTDEGSGIYRFKLTIDGEEIDVRDLTTPADVTAEDRVGTCFDVDARNADPYEFAHQQPCPASLERTLTISTSSVDDGPHRLRAVVEDAGGNETALVDRTVVVDNHPAPELVDGAVPTLTGTPAVGAPLSGENGRWRNATEFDYLWERCATETTCEALVDFPGRTYVATPEDVGKRLRFLVIATNDVGEWTTSTSSYSAPVAPAGESSPIGGEPAEPAVVGSRPGESAGAAAATPPSAQDAARPAGTGPNGRGATADALLVATAAGRAKLRTRFAARPQVAGRLTDRAGRPIAGAVLQLSARPSSAGAVSTELGTTITGDDGGFSYALPPGPSRRIDVAYRASLADERPAATASVRLIVPASLSLRVRPARPGRTTWMTGRLRHLPRAGLQVQVQALDGRRWRTFDTTTTRRGGRFRYGYRFKPTAAGRSFQLRVLVQSPIYPFARGASRAVPVRVPR